MASQGVWGPWFWGGGLFVGSGNRLSPLCWGNR